eukprot:NODE_2714_length_1006_cov_91.806598_g2694_i0.p1 GENE.NODE_2714_length_1006_cov_91.806598_g2694_i0~~NODE_2714_length_1006_cov_91.806598_g2694_i0.p1  ORF type:complete len:300 (+),score=72.24 NODE_2714_length_1006_cov_91.806598_g2694_i0:58-900(+)
MDVNFTSTLVATAGADQCVKVWDCLTGECLTTIPHPTPVRCVAFNHGDTAILTVTDQSYNRKPAVHCYNLPGTTPDELRNCQTQYNPWLTHEVSEKITCAVWGPTNDTIYFSSDDGTIVKLDTHEKLEKSFVQAHKREVRRIVWDAEHLTLISGSLDQSAKLWDGETLKELKVYDNDKPVNDVAISSAMPHVLLGGGTDAQSVTNASHRQNKFETRFYHKVLCEELGAISGHFGPVNALAIAPDGSGFATGGEDGFVRLHHFDEAYFNAEDSQEPALKSA